MEKPIQSFETNIGVDENSSHETILTSDITLDNFRDIVSNIHSQDELNNYKNELNQGKTKIIKNKKLFTEDKKDKPGKPIDPNFKSIDSKDLFYDLNDTEIKNILAARENELRKDLAENSNQEGAIDELEDESEKGISEIATERHEARETSTGSSEIDPAIILHAEQPENLKQKSEQSELNSESINNTKTLKELSALLAVSDGIDSPTQGHFSGADLVFLVDRIKKGEAYIEELTRENGLREKVWNLVINETGNEPKSMDNETELNQTDQALVENEKFELPAHPPAPTDRLKKTIPLTPEPQKKSLWGGVKKLFGFGK